MPEVKASAAGPVIALHMAGRPRWTPRDYGAFAREGFQKNPVVHRAVRMIAEGAASVPFLAFDGDAEAEGHKLTRLLQRPNAMQTGADLMEAAYASLMIAGNAYVEAVRDADGAVRELYVLRADRVKVLPGADGWPEAYLYAAGGREVRLARADVMHLKLFHPADDHYGLSPLEAAAEAVDLHNQMAAWNKALLDNAARPSGALVYRGHDGVLSDDQFQRLKDELDHQRSGPRGAGRPLVLEGGLEWTPMSLTPHEMDFDAGRNAAARDIAMAFGVPPMLLGIPGDATYANYEAATLAFWRGTVLPLVRRMAAALTAFIADEFGEGLRLEGDADAIPALAPERAALWARLDAAGFLTTDEKRIAAGYGAG
ncbi:MAG: phage portal protein [Micropepsaceae bacterium]